MTTCLQNAPQEGQLNLLGAPPRRELTAALDRARLCKTYVMLMIDGWWPQEDTGTIIALDERQVTLAVNSTHTVGVPRNRVTGLASMEHWREHLTPGCDCQHCTTEYGTPGRPICCKQTREAMSPEHRTEMAESLAG